MSASDDPAARAPEPRADPAAGDEDRVAILTAERDAALAASYRQRDRLQAEIDRAHREKRAKDRELRQIRLQLATMKRRFLFRAQRKIGRVLAPFRDLTRRRTPLVNGPRDRVLDVDPIAGDTIDRVARFRAEMTDRMSGRFEIDERPIRIAVIEHAPDAEDGEKRRDAIDVALSGVGMEPSRVADVIPGNATDSGIDVVLLLDPTADIDWMPRGAIRVAWLGDRPDRWLSMPRFEDLDIVLVGDDASRVRIEAGSAKSASVSADPATAAGARDVQAAILRWLAAPHVAIHIGPQTWEAAASWGDTPFGRSLQKAFERRGWPATLHVFADRDTASAVRADLSLRLFGVRAPVVRPGQTSVLWIISHPDMVTREMCLPYDLIAVVSDPFLRYLRGWLGNDCPPLLALHQATDPDRFHPETGGPPHELLFVGNSRHRRRAILDALAGTTHDLAVYGGNWTADLLDLRYLRGSWIPNDGLRRHYASAAIVLSDAYPDMRDEGFIANRVYDALASGGFVISEAVEGIEQEFDGSVVTFRDGAELVDRIDHFLAHPEERRALAAAGRRVVLERHTFDHRVEALVEAVTPLLPAR